MDLNGARRKNATRETTSTLKAWLNDHKKNPYPTKGEKIMLAIITKMTLTQVSTWFANARRRLKKENKMTWEPRNRVEDEDNNNEDDDSGRKSVDEKDRLGKCLITLSRLIIQRSTISSHSQRKVPLPRLLRPKDKNPPVCRRLKRLGHRIERGRGAACAPDGPARHERRFHWCPG